MKITKVNIPIESINNGLMPVKMHRLGQVVILAGKNGSGKSRLLNLISNTIQVKPTKQVVEQIQSQKDDTINAIAELNSELQMLEKDFRMSPIHNPEAKSISSHRISKLKQRIINLEADLKNPRYIITWDLIETDTLANSYPIVPFVPKNLNIRDSNSYRKTDLIQSASKIDIVGTDELNLGTFSRIQVIQDRMFNATHPDFHVSKTEKENAINDYENLRELIRIFLNTELERNLDGEPTLFGFPLGKANLSDGQKVLIQFCLAIHCQQKSLDDLILFLDEPENHLHPSLIIDMIERLIKNTSHGQIWIATHSIPILANFDQNCIWFMDNNKVSYAGSIPETVLSSLLGTDEQRAKLHNFVSLPAIHALNLYAYECLIQPNAVLTPGGDPQAMQINKEIIKHLKDRTKIRVLDYGAGKGRILANIIENNTESFSNFIKWFDYIAYDKDDIDKEDCLSTLSKVYENADQRYYNDLSQLFGKYDRESFDVVVMCNVLHEVDPKDWLKLFANGGEIPELLSENGILLLVEDQVMSIGEQAYQKGFIVLDTGELKELFNIKEKDADFGYSDARGDGRLKAHRLKREYLTRITAESRISAIQILNDKATERILEIRGESASYKNGRRHGFWIEQLANSTLCLRELTSTTSTVKD